MITQNLNPLPMIQPIFIVVGWLNIPKQIVYEIFNKTYKDCRCWFVNEEKHLKSRFTYANNNGKKIQAIFIGPVPHKSFAAGKNSSMVTEICIADSKTPVYVCRTKAGILKFTKTSLGQAISVHDQYLRQITEQQADEEREIMETNTLVKTLFPE